MDRHVLGLRSYIRDGIDLAALIRSSTGSMAIEIGHVVTSRAVALRQALERAVDRLVLPG